MTTYRLLGGLSLHVGPGDQANLPPFRAQGLLALLLLEPTRPRPKSRLIAELWPDLEPQDGLARLSDAVYLIRRSDPGLQLDVGRDFVQWSGQSRTTDLGQFLGAWQTESLAQDLIPALELYRGELLPEFDLPEINQQRVFLHARYASGLDSVSRTLETEGRPGEALLWAEKWMSAFPGDEAAVRRVLQLCLVLGHRSRGLEAYERARRYWEREYQLRPDPHLKKLAAELAVRRPVAPKTNAAVSALDRALLLQEAATATRLLAEGESRHSGQPEWRLRHLALRTLQGDYVWVSTEAETLLLEVPNWGLSEAARHRIQAVTLILWADALSETESIDSALRAFDRAGAEIRRLSTRASQAADAWESEYMGSEALGAWLVLHKAEILFRSGRTEASFEMILQLRGILDEALHDVRRPWAEVLSLRLTSMEASHLTRRGRNQEAVERFDRLALDSAALGALEIEQRMALTRSLSYDNLGRWDEAEALLRKSREVLSDEALAARVVYNLAAHLGNRDDRDLAEAESLAKEAVARFTSLSQEGWEASSRTTLGFILWQRHLPILAREQYDQAAALHTKLGEELYTTELLSYRALCYLNEGDNEQALAMSLRGVEESLRAGETMVSADVWTARYLVLQATGHPERAREALVRAAELAFVEAEDLAPEEARAYLNRDPMMRRLRDALAAQSLLANYLVRLPADTVPTEGPSPALRQELVRRAWARRVLEGRRPAVRDLARAVGASIRTVERDLGQLRALGRLTPPI